MKRTTRELWTLSGQGNQAAGRELMRRTDTSPEARKRSNRECAERARKAKRFTF